MLFTSEQYFALWNRYLAARRRIEELEDQMRYPPHSHACSEGDCAERVTCSAPPEMDEDGNKYCPHDTAVLLFWCEEHEPTTARGCASR